MAIPKKHAPRVEKFVEIVIGMVVEDKLSRAFYRAGDLDKNYRLSLYSTGLLPWYNDDRIEFQAAVNDKKTECFFISGKDLADKKVDPTLVKTVADAIMKLRIKEIK